MNDIQSRIEVLRLAPGDTLVLHFQQHLTTAQREAIKQQAAPFAPDGVKVMVLDGGATITHVAAPVAS
jgi:hypothetical protein